MKHTINKSRSYNASRNIIVSFISRIVEEVLAFATRTVFIHLLSAEYLGLSSLLINVLNVLNLAELGIGTAINVALYSPLANNDENKIIAYIRLYKKAYRCIGIAILLIGFILIPFLPYFVKDTTEQVNLTFVYLLYLFNTALSYLLFAYKRSLLEADQKVYIINIVNCALTCIFKFTQIGLLICFKSNPELSFYVYCGSSIAQTLINNFIISHIVNKKYKYLKRNDDSKLSKDEIKSLFKNVYGVALYKISSTVNNSADSVIISSFLSTSLLGLYSNYLTIANAVMTLSSMFFRPLVSSIGNLNAIGDTERKQFVYDTIHLAAFWIKGFCFISLWILLTPFVKTVWLGESFAISDYSVFFLCLNYLVDGLMSAPILFRDSCGLYWQSRYRAILTVIVNVTLSIFFTTRFHWGIPGILLATIISRIGITLWVDTQLVHKYVLNRRPYRYFAKYFVSLFIILATGFLVYFLGTLVGDNTLLGVAYRFGLCITIPNIIWFLLFHKTEEFKYLKDMVTKFIHR